MQISCPPAAEKAGSPVSLENAVPVERMPKAAAATSASDVKMTKLVVVANHDRFNTLKAKLEEIGVTGITVSQVMGAGMQKGHTEYYRGVEVDINLLPKVKVEIVVCKIPVGTVIAAIKEALYTGHIGDGPYGRGGLRRFAGRNRIKAPISLSHCKRENGFEPFSLSHTGKAPIFASFL